MLAVPYAVGLLQMNREHKGQKLRCRIVLDYDEGGLRNVEMQTKGTRLQLTR